MQATGPIVPRRRLFGGALRPFAAPTY